MRIDSNQSNNTFCSKDKNIISDDELILLKDEESEYEKMQKEETQYNEVQSQKNTSSYITENNDNTDHKKKNNNVYYDAVNDLTQLARARKSGEVRVIRARLLSKTVQISKSGLEPEEVVILISKIRKIIRKADKKLKGLQIEENMETKQKKAEIKRQTEEAKKINNELNRRIKRRRQEEENDILEEKKQQAGHVNHNFSTGAVLFSAECIYNETSYESNINISDTTEVNILL